MTSDTSWALLDLIVPHFGGDFFVHQLSQWLTNGYYHVIIYNATVQL